MLKSVVNLFFPSVCSGCDAFLIKNEKVICTRCRHEIPLTNHLLNPNNAAFSKFYGKVEVTFAAALFYFHKKGIVQEMIHKLKYKGHEEIGTTIGHWFSSELKNFEPIKKVDYIIPVPLHPRKLKERGYNQVTTFGKALSESLEIPFNETTLVRKMYSKTQTNKSLDGRTDLSYTIFDVINYETLQNKHFLLIDDVITTGSTLEACCRALLKIPGARISILCMAMSEN
jgi:ComF family protein